MTIRFKCPHCQKPLSVKEHLAGKKAACPACKKGIIVPAAAEQKTAAGPPPSAPMSAPIDVEALAAAALADKPADKAPEPATVTTIELTCPFCDEELKLPADLAGKKTPCPACSKIITVPVIEIKVKKDWRTVQKGGPSAALANQPEQLTDAWGTEQKGRVSREAMEEAGAVPEPRAEAVGVAGWLKRGFWLCVVAVAAVVLIAMANRARVESREKDHVQKAEKYLAQLDPLGQAEFHRAVGELEVRNMRADEAQNRFNLAGSLVPPPAQDKGPPELVETLERDLLLIRLVLSQVEMGGTGDETLKRGLVTYRFDWKDEIVQKDMLQTLEAIHNQEAKASALRLLARKLLDKDKAEIAISMAGAMANTTGATRSPVRAEQVALLLARGEKAAAEPMEPPNIEAGIADTSIRVAYTEGDIYQKKYEAALKFATAKGPVAGRLEACVAGAALALADAKNPDAAKEALPFIREALAAAGDILKAHKDRLPSWTVMELIRLGSRTDAADDVKNLIASLPPPYQPRAKLDLFVGSLERNPTKPGDGSRIDDIGPAGHPARALAWEALARHNARLGYTSSISPEDVEESCRPFVHLGIALGEKDALLKS
jgi:hypothetical protein